MATWDSADLLARCKTMAQRPSTDESMPDATWYQFLSDAQDHWYGVFATHVPWILMGAPTLLESSDSNETYDIPTGDGTPLAIEVYSAKDGYPLKVCPYWDSPGGDYVWEGTSIRFPAGKTRSFTSGPYARYIAQPAVISAASEPTLAPNWTRKLLVFHALGMWATIGGKRDPKPFEKLEQKAWSGDPSFAGDMGILGALKLQNALYGTAAYSQSSGTSLANITTIGY
jgi:hypothetical protein